MTTSPYAGLPDHRFWRKAVAEVPPAAVDPIIDLPFTIRPTDKVATGGSCFAQHIAKRLQGSGLQYYQVEQPPAGLPVAEANERQYGVYSCRYGNIYTTRQLLQLFDRAFGLMKPTLDGWRRPDGRYVDPFRPRVEPKGFATIEELHVDRDRHLAAVRTMLETMDVFLFTFGLTESWVHTEDGAVLPLPPGVEGGTWDETRYRFWNATASEVASDYLAFVDKLKAINPRARLIVSVSPVPIIATYVPRHVLVSNSASKSKLRVACDEVVTSRPEIAYFPSYDLVTLGPNAGRYYKDNLRELNQVGLSAVMRAFFSHFASERDLASREPGDELASVLSTKHAVVNRCNAFPARSWSVHTPRQLLQLFDRAYGLFWPDDEVWVDAHHGSFIDPFRPRVRPEGFPSREELELDRDTHLAAARSLFETSSGLIITFEMAQGWEASSDGAIFPLPPPGLHSLDPNAYRLREFEAPAMEADIRRLIGKLRQVNPRLRLIFAVSPPPLARDTGEASGNVVLRTVVARITRDTANTAYLPTYEMVCGPQAGAMPSDEILGVVSVGDAPRDVASLLEDCRLGTIAPFEPTGEGEPPAPAGFDAQVSISHLQTVICDEVAIEQAQDTR